MEFWGEEVKPGMAVLCKADEGYVIHLSQAALGETKKASENVVVSVKVGEKKFVIGTLSAEKCPQVTCDLIFDKDFELSHNSKAASVFLCGYKSEMPGMYESDSGDDEEEMIADENPVKNNVIVPVENGKNKKPSAEETSSGDDDFSDSDDLSTDEESEDEEMSSGADGSTDDESEDESEEETPNKPEVGKKRAAETVLNTPASDKKAKIATPSAQKTGDKKSVHVATPHPAKQAIKPPADKSAGKTPADKPAGKTPAGDKKKEKSPKSGSHACKSCSKTFASDVALQSHQKAKKHEA